MYAPPRPKAVSRIRVVASDGFAVAAARLAAGYGPRNHLHLVGVAPGGVELVRMASLLLPDVLLMDVRMPVMDGVRATRCLIAARIPSKIVVVSDKEDLSLAHLAIDAGADDLLVRGRSRVPDVFRAITRAAEMGERVYMEPWETAV